MPTIYDRPTPTRDEALAYLLERAATQGDRGASTDAMSEILGRVDMGASERAAGRYADYMARLKEAQGGYLAGLQGEAAAGSGSGGGGATTMPGVPQLPSGSLFGAPQPPQAPLSQAGYTLTTTPGSMYGVPQPAQQRAVAGGGRVGSPPVASRNYGGVQAQPVGVRPNSGLLTSALALLSPRDQFLRGNR